jgi:hypothetical protein
MPGAGQARGSGWIMPGRIGSLRRCRALGALGRADLLHDMGHVFLNGTEGNRLGSSGLAADRKLTAEDRTATTGTVISLGGNARLWANAGSERRMASGDVAFIHGIGYGQSRQCPAELPSAGPGSADVTQGSYPQHSDARVVQRQRHRL